MQCPHCGAETRPGAGFCAHCFGPLQGEAAIKGASTVAGSLAPGSHLHGGRYYIARILGWGGVGAAWLANDQQRNGRRVVIKELLSDAPDPWRREQDFKQLSFEISILAHLDHPFLPRVLDHFLDRERYFLVCEYIEGEHVERRLAQFSWPLAEREVLVYASELLDLLDYLENNSPPIFHGDIKPTNIVIGQRDGDAHLVNLMPPTAQQARNRLRQRPTLLGTPGYAAPEQYQGQADHRSDLYALAVTLHQLLTGYDPRQQPPFSYPPVRALNPGISPETERVLMLALQADPNQRYQHAALMKREIDAILLRHFGVPFSTPAPATGQGTSLPLAASASPVSGLLGQPQTPPPATAAVTQADRLSLSPSSQPSQATQPAQSESLRPIRRRRRQPMLARPLTLGKRQVPLSHLLLVIGLLVVILGATVLLALPRLTGPGDSTAARRSGAAAPPALAPSPPTLPNGIGGYTVTDPATGQKDYIGISDGRAAFDTNRPDGKLKQQAAQHLQSGDVGGAAALWQSALSLDENDAEALIYLEDQRVLSSGSPYITFVVATMLSGPDPAAVGAGRGDLQGAYLAQKEYNSGGKLGGGLQVRLLIANSGGNSLFATTVAQQIVQAARADKTIVGIMGWPYSSRALNALPILAQAHLPMVSETASSDLLTGRSPYFFRVCPSDHQQGLIGADYSYQRLQARRVALFFDPADAYSQSLATAFSTRYRSDGGSIVVSEQYTVGKSGNLPALLRDALMHQPDLIYFAGFSADVAGLLSSLPTSGPFAHLQVMGGDGLYLLQGYPKSARAGFLRLHFTAFAYPDEWGYLALPQPAFFTTYAQVFNANGQQSGYGYTRPFTDSMLAYDATLVLLEAGRSLISSGKAAFNGQDLQQALARLNGSRSVQGISGVIAFGSDGNPQNKAVVVLTVDSVGHIKLESIQGRFLK
ncbi:ABC transporter substrate-binding protein [Thermogemmatispora sp.]|uniref:ABC transporter substrate-binding protein n=1 Tax=Thermogemmatispora sp. TaxID=1968838 RepID=UPI001D2236D2|nr:ABC transporter substrate-binding protein [Thermogemmatispora sp.]MBX5450851.1 ABC transporter substrate-binding protein [Thermogemmatispora sp.]